MEGNRTVAQRLRVLGIVMILSGIFGFGVAGLISPSSFGYLVDRTGSWVYPFTGSVVLLLIGAILTARLRPDVPFETPEEIANA